MTKVFEEYSTYYDLLYQDKDYAKEADYIANLIQKFSPDAKTILELGCGTGKHAYLLANKGYEVFGIDLSESMLYEAKKLGIECKQADVRHFRANKTFDAVVSLFHVASYQISNQDIKDYFDTAQVHLEKGGIFIFDCWYGPAVLNQKPEKKFKSIENEVLKVERTATPIHHINENRVDVTYDILIKNKSNNSEKRLQENHKVRYFFKPELQEFLEQNNIELIHVEEWLSENEPSENTWGVCFIGVKK